MKIGIVDYGCGNFTSVWNAILKLVPEKNILCVKSVNDIENVTHLILPGVGAFKHAMARLNEMGLVEKIKSYILDNNPFLGICVGMQVMALYGNEFERCEGLGIIKSEVVKFANCSHKYNVPHIGWNSLNKHSKSCLFTGIEEDATFYFVHSYYTQLYPSEDIEWGIANYADVNFAATFSKGNVHGVQFHPEKSQFYGLKLLENFIKNDKDARC